MLLSRQEEEIADEGGSDENTVTHGHCRLHQKPNGTEGNVTSLVHEVGAVSHQELERPFHLVV